MRNAVDIEDTEHKLVAVLLGCGIGRSHLVAIDTIEADNPMVLSEEGKVGVDFGSRLATTGSLVGRIGDTVSGAVLVGGRDSRARTLRRRRNRTRGTWLRSRLSRGLRLGGWRGSRR